MSTLYDVGITLPPGAAGEVRTTCPRCSPYRRKHTDPCLAINADTGVWHCWHCGWSGGCSGRQNGYHAPVRPPHRPPQPDESKSQSIRRTWEHSRPIRAVDPVGRYLTHRGLAPILSAVPPVLRYHPRLAYRHDDDSFTHHPALVAMVQAPTGELVSLHRTYLTADGRKADVPSAKKLMAPPVSGGTKGGAVRLQPAGDTLCISEGIETALAVHLATGIPTWATIGTGGMQGVVLPPGVRLVVICADNDAPGLAAARELAKRMLGEDRRVKLISPQVQGHDWLDVIGG